jgi:hypothetical protein
MRPLTRNIAPALLLALFGSRADTASIRETIPLPLASDKTSVVQDFGRANEGTKESYTEAHYTKAIHQFAPSPVVPFRVELPSCPDEYVLHFSFQQTVFRSSFYYSSFCNKAPPIA